MKNLNAFLLFFVLVAFFIACDSKTKKKVVEKPTTLISESTDTLDLISKATFKKWVKSWKNNDTGYIDTIGMTYFNVPLIDLEDILNEDADSARVYLGLETLSPGHYAPHIMFVGIKDGTPDLDIIADYTRICPPWCDTLPSR